MNHNPNECDIVQDLLPLYYDHACSPASCELVRQHLADCADCEKIYTIQHNAVRMISIHKFLQQCKNISLNFLISRI